MPKYDSVRDYIEDHPFFHTVPIWSEVEQTIRVTELGFNMHDLRNKWVVYQEDPMEMDGEIYIEKWFLQRDLYEGSICWGELFMDETAIFDWRTAKDIAKKVEGTTAVRISDYLRDQEARIRA